MKRIPIGLTVIAGVLLLSSCSGETAAPAPTTTLSEETSVTPPPTSSTPVATTPVIVKTTTVRVTTKKKAAVPTGPGCAEKAMAAKKFNPACAEYQGYLDPGGPGRGKTSGDVQHEYGCEQGYIPKEEC